MTNIIDLDPRTELGVYVLGVLALAGSGYYAWQSGNVIPLVLFGSVLGVVIVLTDDEITNENE